MQKELIYENLGGKIRQARAERAMNQAELARRVGLSRTSITNVELGRQGLAVHQLFEFAEALGVQAVQLLPEKLVEKHEKERELPADVIAWVEALKGRKFRT